MPEPLLHTPLDGYNLPRLEKTADDSCGVWANEDPHNGYINIRGRADDSAFLEAAASALGLALPASPCTFVAGNGAKVLWLAPDEWMVVCGPGRRHELLQRIARELATTQSQVVDNSGGYTQIILKGRNGGDVLRHVCVYDPELLTPGRVVGTAFAKASAYISRGVEGYCLLVRRSFADYIWLMLARAAEPYGFGIARLRPGEGLGLDGQP